jgi:hypothetical protein
VQGSELLKVPHVSEQVAIPRAVVVDESHRWGSWGALLMLKPPFAGSDLHTAYPT